MKKIKLLILLIAIGAVSCEDKEKPVQSSDEPAARPEIAILLDSINACWDAMIASDDQKFADIKRLLEEISYTKKFNVMLKDSLAIQADRVKASRYNQETMDVDRIVAYDEATDELVMNVFKLKASTPGIEQHPLADQLEEEIAEANNNTLIKFRSKYDLWAIQFNDHLKNNKKEIEKLGEPYRSLKERKLFGGEAIQ